MQLVLIPPPGSRLSCYLQLLWRQLVPTVFDRSLNPLIVFCRLHTLYAISEKNFTTHIFFSLFFAILQTFRYIQAEEKIQHTILHFEGKVTRDWSLNHSRDLAFKCVGLPTESGNLSPDPCHKRDRGYKTYHLHMYQEPKVNNSGTE